MWHLTRITFIYVTPPECVKVYVTCLCGAPKWQALVRMEQKCETITDRFKRLLLRCNDNRTIRQLIGVVSRIIYGGVPITEVLKSHRMDIDWYFEYIKHFSMDMGYDNIKLTWQKLTGGGIITADFIMHVSYLVY